MEQSVQQERVENLQRRVYDLQEQVMAEVEAFTSVESAVEVSIHRMI